MSDPLFTFTLSEAWPYYIYTASCSDCQHWTRIDLKKLAEQLGDDFPLQKLRIRLRCSACRGKRIIIATIPKETGVASNALKRWPFNYD